MAIADWLVHFQNAIQIGNCMLSLITSGDIDAVPIHLYTLSKFGKRDSNNKLVTQVFVVLSKPRGKLDIYNISGLLFVFEDKYKDLSIGEKIAYSLCIGCNDFIPKLYNVSHEKVLTTVTSNAKLLDNLFCIRSQATTLRLELFKEMVKQFYCPKKVHCQRTTYENIRAMNRND